MLSIETAREQILANAPTPKTRERCGLEAAHGRVTAGDITAEHDVPPAANSAMDGYALRAAEWSSDHPAFPVQQRIVAGRPGAPLKPRTSARILTGAEIPEGADCVAIQENCELTDSGEILIHQPPLAGDNVRPRGQDIATGQTVVNAGERLCAQHLGLLASQGKQEIDVWCKPKVALMSTGDELVEPGQTLKPGQVYNSNRIMLSAWLTQLGADVVWVQHVADTSKATTEALEQASSQADLIIATGGVSVGEEDHVKPAVEALGQLKLWKIAMKPGKPLAFGRVRDACFLGLPGNPVSAFVTFFLFGQALIDTMSGAKPRSLPSYRIPAAFSVSRPRKRTEFIRVQVINDRLHAFSNQSSGVLSSVSWADGLAELPAGEPLAEGDCLTFFPFSGGQH